MIYCVWYPSGGFGHFINAVLTLHGKDFVKPKNSLEFSSNGNSHSLDLVVPKYLHDCWPGGINFAPDKNYCVLIDNGIGNENTKFKATFPSATIIKVCYSDYSWPVVARTMIEKAMESSMEQQLDTDNWNSSEAWVRREKYFLFLRDHHFRSAWRPTVDNFVCIDDVFDYTSFFAALNSIVETDSFYPLWEAWRGANNKYIKPIDTASLVLSHIRSNSYYDLKDITDEWTQAVVYYYIWLQYHFEVPHNDYASWFTSTDDIRTMLHTHQVTF